MPVLTPLKTDEVYTQVILSGVPHYGGFKGMTLAVLTDYRDGARKHFLDVTQRRIYEELAHAKFTAKTMARELGGYDEGTLRSYLRGGRKFGFELIFAIEVWLEGIKIIEGEDAFSPFSKGVIESSRVAGYCKAILAVRNRAPVKTSETLTHAEFWQLHSMYAQPGWQMTNCDDLKQFQWRANERSKAAAKEHYRTFIDFERRDPPKDIQNHYSFAMLKQLDDEWGLPYLIARVCLACGADDEHVVEFPPPKPETDA